MSPGEVRVIDPGLLTTIQDDRGRSGLGRFGIPPGGAMDARAARLANRLVGNLGNAPVLEITLHGPTLEWTCPAHIGLAGADLGAATDGLRLPPGYSYRMRSGDVLTFEGPRSGAGARAYLAVEGGFDVAPVLGSTSTDRRSGFGGHEGRALAVGDVLEFVAGTSSPLSFTPRAGERREGPLRFIPTPAGLPWFAREAVRALLATTWTVAPDSDRNGIRLMGARLSARASGIPSVGVPLGAVQVPPGGEPIITMVDGPVTGGYPVIGFVPALDHGRLAQAAPGSELHFVRTSVNAVRREMRQLEDEDRVEVDDGDAAAGWAGWSG